MDIKEINNTTNQQDLLTIDTTLHPTTAECTLFAGTIGQFTKTDRIRAIKQTSTNLKEIIQSSFPWEAK